MPDIFKDVTKMDDGQLQSHREDQVRSAIHTLLLGGYRIFKDGSEIVPNNNKCGSWKFIKRETP